MNAAMASFNTTVRQMTEMFQWPQCLSEKNSVAVSLGWFFVYFRLLDVFLVSYWHFLSVFIYLLVYWLWVVDFE